MAEPGNGSHLRALVVTQPEDVRSLFPVTERNVVLDNAVEGPCPVPVADALRRHLRDAVLMPSHDRDVDALAEAAYARLERVLGVPRRNLAFVSSATGGFLFLAGSLPLVPDDVVLIPENEYPATVLPWLEREMRGGARVQRLPVRPDAAGGAELASLLEQLKRPEVKALCLSAIGWLGHRYPLGELADACCAAGVLLLVDGSQAVGMVQLRLVEDNIPFLSTTFSKWAFGPEGIGCVYISDDLRARLRPVLVSAESSIQSSQRLPVRLASPDPPAPLVLTIPPPICLSGLTAALDLLLDIGLPVIEPYVMDLAQYAICGLLSCGYDVRGGSALKTRSAIVTFSHPDPSRNGEIFDALRSEGIHVSHPEGLLRLSMHVYNDTGDLRRLLRCLDSIGTR